MHVGIERPLPVIQGDVVEVLVVALVGRVVDQDIETVQFAGHAVYERSRLCRVTDVAGYQHGFAPGLFDLLLHMAGVVLLAIEECDGNVGAFARESDRHRRADTAVTAGDQCLLALQQAMPAITVLAVVRRGCICAVLPGKDCCWAGNGGRG